MADFGISETGFKLKRLEDIRTESKERAVSIFQDLLTPEDVVDTSDSSTIGRFINIFAVPDSTLWEQAQLSYSSLDPNTAMGIALDNIVQYGGIQRLNPSSSTVSGVFKGDNGTLISLGSVVGFNTQSNTFSTTGAVSLTPIAASGVDITVSTVADSTIYNIPYSVSSVSTNVVVYTSGTGATQSSILAGLKAEIISAHPLLSADVIGSVLKINKTDVFQTSTFSVSSQLLITKVAKLGNLRADVAGAVSGEANTLVSIKTPVLGWDSVYNPLAVSEGRLVETDEQLRLRFRNSKFKRSSNILDSLYSAITNVPTVENVVVYDNPSDSTDSNGLPPHSFTAVVLGGDSQVIAETIWINKPVGITANGNTSVNIVDSQHFTRAIHFERPAPINIYITIALSTNELFAADGADKIRSAIIQYAKDNFSVGDDIIYSRIYTPVNSVAGHSVTSLFIGTSPSPTATANIPISFNQIGSFQSVNITITTS